MHADFNLREEFMYYIILNLQFLLFDRFQLLLLVHLLALFIFMLNQNLGQLELTL